MWPLKTILYFALFWAGCFLSLANPIWGLFNYLMAYQANPTNTWWGKPLVEIGMRFSMLAAVFCLLGFFFGHKRVPKVRPFISLWEMGILALLFIALVNLVAGTENTATTRYAFEKFWKMQVFVLVLARLGSTRKNLLFVLWALTLGSLYLGHDAYNAPPDSFFLGRLNRIGGPDFSTTSGLAAHLAAMLPLVGVVFLISKKWRLKALAALSAAFTVNAIIMCRTRSAFIGLGIGAIAAILMAPKARRYRIHIMLALGAIAAFSLTDSHFWKRMSTLQDREALQTDMATVTRAEIWRTSLSIIADHPLGIGTGNFPRTIGMYDSRHRKRSSHNTVLVCFVELGIHGGLLFMALSAGSVWYLYRSYRLAHLTENPLETRLLAYGIIISFVTYFVTGLGTERFYCESYWWVLALPVCLHRMVLREARVHDLVMCDEPEPLDHPVRLGRPQVAHEI